MFKNKILKLFESPNNGSPGGLNSIGVGSIPSNQNGLQPRCPSFPMQGDQAIHEEETPQNTIAPLQLGNITIEGYQVIEQNQPSSIRYKVIKDGVPMPVDPKRQHSKDIGHTSDQVLKKLSVLPNKIKLIRQFLTYDKNNKNTLKTNQQKTVG